MMLSPVVLALLGMLLGPVHAFRMIQGLRQPPPKIRASIELRAKATAPRAVVPQHIPLEIVYEDPDMLVINKPPGMTVQLAQGAVENAVVYYLNATSVAQWQTAQWPWNSDVSFEGIVHRLDKGTSGLLVVGKHRAAARALAAAFRERRVNKTYLAIGVGLPNRRSSQRLAAIAAVNSQSSRSSTVTRTENGAAPGQSLLTRAIKSCGRDAERALALVEQACATGERPDAQAYSAAISVCVRALGSEVDEGATAAHGARAMGPRRDRLTTRRASIRDGDAVGLRARVIALSLLDSMRDRDVTPSVGCFQAAIGLCAREPPLWQRAVELIDQMEACGVRPTTNCVSTAISACGRAGRLDAALRLLPPSDALAEDGACLRAAIRAAERSSDADTARALAKRLELAGPGGGCSGGPGRGGWPAGGVAVGEAMVVDEPIGRLGKYTMGIMAIADGGRTALSEVTPLAFDGTCSLNRVKILTGRTHQIRVHMASVLGCPMAGDRDYGSGWQRDATRRRGATSRGTPLGAPRAPVQRVMLHAAELALPHPTTGAVLRLACPPPADFLTLAGAMAGSVQSAEP